MSTWGKHSKPITERYTNIYLYYRLVGEDKYKSVQSKIVDLTANYKVGLSDIAQYEKYEFTITPYPKNITGKIEYYIDITFDGHPNHLKGIKKIQLIN